MSQGPVTITVTLDPAVALQLAQFCKRSTFDTFFDFTEAHLSDNERCVRANMMILGIEAIARSLAEAGYDPR
jgi:hypothetical protein